MSQQQKEEVESLPCVGCGQDVPVDEMKQAWSGDLLCEDCYAESGAARYEARREAWD